MTKKKKLVKHAGWFGLFGFLGFQYFADREVYHLFWFSFFAFFSCFVLGRLAEAMPDERYIENSNKAKQKICWIPLFIMFLVGWSGGWPFATREFMVLVCALGWAATFLAYAALFVYYENH